LQQKILLNYPKNKCSAQVSSCLILGCGGYGFLLEKVILLHSLEVARLPAYLNK